MNQTPRTPSPIRSLLALAALLLIGCPESSTSSDASPDRADATLDAPDAPDATVAPDTLDASDARDASGLDALDAVDAPDSLDAPDVPDDVPRCTPGMTQPCTCYQSVPGEQRCQRAGRWGYCTCQLLGDVDAGTPTETLPPRLLAPLSGTRVMSQRPTLRWVLPAGLARARVELCGDRACTRRITQQEVTGSSWRSPTTLSPGVVFWRVAGLATDGSVAWTSATWSFAVRHRDTPIDTANIPLHDFDGDGFDDVAVRANGVPGEGVRVFFGATGGIRETPTILRNPLGSDRTLGTAVAVGDFNGDGFADLAASHQGTDDEHRQHPEIQGHVYAFYGASDGLSTSRRTSITMTAEPGVPFEWAGRYGIGLGAVDFNGDGFDDLAVLRDTSGVRSRYPKVFLYLGSDAGIRPDAVVTLPIPPELVVNVRSVWAVGDVDRDGYGEVAVNFEADAQEYEALQVLHGNPAARLGMRIEEIDDPHLAFFAEYGAGGDFNGDGFADVFTGGVGHVVVYYGSDEGIRRLLRLPPPPLGYELSLPFGHQLWIQGDLNGDGIYDVAAGGACDESQWEMDRFCQNGRVILYSSTTAGMATTPARRLASAYSDFWSVWPNDGAFAYAASPGDLNADGIDDLIVGSGGSHDEATVAGGSIHIYLGGRWDWTRPFTTIWGDRMNLWMGRGVF